MARPPAALRPVKHAIVSRDLIRRLDEECFPAYHVVSIAPIDELNSLYHARCSADSALQGLSARQDALRTSPLRRGITTQGA